MNTVMKDNSKEMSTIVETFVLEETSDLIWDNEKLDKWNEMVSMLGLKGQTNIITKDKSPIPFLPLKTSMISVFETLCPRRVDIKDFSVQPIPVEILSLVSLSVSENYFDKIEIWYDEKTPDPLCVGITGYWYQYNYGSDRNTSLDGLQFKTKQECLDAGATAGVYYNEINKYLIGKWADVKHSFEELRKMATKRFISERTNDIKRNIKQYQRQLDDLDSEAFDRFN